MSQPLSDTELDELRADYGKPWSTTSWNGLRWQKALATIDALRTQLAVQRKVVAAAETIIANADGHPDMCCGQCSSAVAAAEAREAKLRAALQTCADIGEMRVAAVVRAALAPESLAAAREWHRVDCNCLVETDMGEWGALCLVGRRLAALDATVRKENKE